MPAINQVRNNLGDTSYSPAENCALVTPNDSTDLSYVTRGISFAGAGALEIVTLGNQTVIVTLAAGIIHPICATRIRAAGTTATGIVAWW